VKGHKEGNMSKLNKILAVLLVVAILAAVIPANVAYAGKGSEKGKPVETGKGAGKEKGVSNGSGDKKGPGASNGKNKARPDQDGKGADHGVVNDDKAWDGNNGCGNDKDDPDSPWEDDNNGRCLGHRKDRPEKEGGSGDDEGTSAQDGGDGGFEGDGNGGDDEQGTQDASIRICFYSHGSAVEVSDVDTDDILGFVVQEGGWAYERTVLAEGWHRVCWDARPGAVYYVLAWNGESGHGGPVYRVEVTGEASGTVEIYNPLQGTVLLHGVLVTRMNPERGRAGTMTPL
jgi:hypothetical protein